MGMLGHFGDVHPSQSRGTTEASNTRHRASTSAHWCYVVIATNPMHRLQINPTVHNNKGPPTIPPTYIQVRAVVWEWSEGHTDTQAAVTNIHFASHMPHTKCKKNKILKVEPKKYQKLNLRNTKFNCSRVCVSLCTAVTHNTAQNSADNLSSRQ